MSSECKKCGESFPFWCVVDGKKRNISKRSYCLRCSPFGQHNTIKLEIEKVRAPKKLKICTKCGKEFNNVKTKRCAVCSYKLYTQKRISRFYDLMGTSCWHCGYDKGIEARAVLDFHHVDPSTKLFQLSAREIGNMGWGRVLDEARKCVQLCCRCHREHHAGMISSEEISKAYKERWCMLEKKIAAA